MSQKPSEEPPPYNQFSWPLKLAIYIYIPLPQPPKSHTNARLRLPYAPPSPSTGCISLHTTPFSTSLIWYNRINTKRNMCIPSWFGFFSFNVEGYHTIVFFELSILYHTIYSFHKKFNLDFIESDVQVLILIFGFHFVFCISHSNSFLYLWLSKHWVSVY